MAVYQQESFGDAWRRVRLHAPDSPFGLVKEWTQHAYEDLVKRRPWNFGRVHAMMSVQASRLVNITFTLGSVTATATATRRTTSERRAASASAAAASAAARTRTHARRCERRVRCGT